MKRNSKLVAKDRLESRIKENRRVSYKKLHSFKWEDKRGLADHQAIEIESADGKKQIHIRFKYYETERERLSAHQIVGTIAGQNPEHIITFDEIQRNDIQCEQCGKIDTVFPKILLGSRWISIPYFLSIIDKDTTFDKNSTISFEPEEDILLVNQAGFGNIFLAFIFLFNRPQEGIVNFTINNGEETVAGEITIKLLPNPFADDYSDSAEYYMEISLDTYTLSDEYSIGGNPL